MNRLLGTAVIAAIVTGCGSDPHAANNGNFERAINSSLEKPAARLCVLAPTLPHKVLLEKQPWNARVQEGVDQPPTAQTPQLEALVSAHLAVKKTGVAAVTYSSFNSRTFQNDEIVKRVPDAIYEADAGYTQSAVSTPTILGEAVTKLCFASLRVQQIDNFSEPGNAMGTTMSSVYYRAKVIDVAPWASNRAMRDAFPDIETDLQRATEQRSAAVVLMSDGWQAE